MMTIAKWSNDEGYLKKIKEEYLKIDKELLEDEMSYELPRHLDKESASKLLQEKELILK